MNLRTLCLCLFFISGMAALSKAQLSHCDSLDLKAAQDKKTLKKFDLFMKDRYYGLSFNAAYDKGYSAGIGYYLYTDIFSRYRKGFAPSFETNLNYHLSGYLLNKITVKLPFLIAPEIAMYTYTDFRRASCFIRPGIGIDACIASFNYNYNLIGTDPLQVGVKHTFSVYFRLGVNRNVWNAPNDGTSQWDRRRSNRKFL